MACHRAASVGPAPIVRSDYDTQRRDWQVMDDKHTADNPPLFTKASYVRMVA